MSRNRKPGIFISHGRYVARIAVRSSEIESALRLRFDVFNSELNEGMPESYRTGMDKDAYDEYCDHLIVCDTEKDMIVGTYRLMPGIVAENSAGYYSENEFDLSSIRMLPGPKLELGRSCVHQAYRNAAVISLLWKGIAAYVEEYDIRHLFGCASLHTSNMAAVNVVYSYLNRCHRAEDPYTVSPLIRIRDIQEFAFCDREEALALMPPLLKGYMRLGARICGEPAYDPLFGTTDFFIILDTVNLLERYRSRFFGRSTEEKCAA